jgi:hypothetical protein
MEGACAMDAHEQQYINLLLVMAVERFSERIIQRNDGVQNALLRLQTNPRGEGVWLNEFVEAFFRDALLDNPAGACLILQAFANERLQDLSYFGSGTTVGDMLQEVAKQIFATLLRRKTEEMLEQALAFGGA